MSALYGVAVEVVEANGHAVRADGGPLGRRRLLDGERLDGAVGHAGDVCAQRIDPGRLQPHL